MSEKGRVKVDEGMRKNKIKRDVGGCDGRRENHRKYILVRAECEVVKYKTSLRHNK